MYRVFRSYHQKNFPVGLHDAYDAQDREAEEADANKHANPGCCIDLVIVGGFKQWVEAVFPNPDLWITSSDYRDKAAIQKYLPKENFVIEKNASSGFFVWSNIKMFMYLVKTHF